MKKAPVYREKSPLNREKNAIDKNQKMNYNISMKGEKGARR